MENEYNLKFNLMFGFVLVNNRSRQEIPLSDGEAIKWSKKPYVSVNLDAKKKLDDILSFEERAWSFMDMNVGN